MNKIVQKREFHSFSTILLCNYCCYFTITVIGGRVLKQCSEKGME